MGMDIKLTNTFFFKKRKKKENVHVMINIYTVTENR